MPHLPAMTSRAVCLSTTLVFSLLTVGCSDGVGSCDVDGRGRDTVLVGGTVQFGGQAILNTSCANGTCHSSTARGARRNGAPAGLDFDLAPVDESDADGEDENKRGDVIVALTDRQVSGLRARQKRVVEQRDEIWDQVKSGLMPPNGLYAGYRQLRSIFDSDESEPCTRGKRFASTSDGAAQEVLRSWLACGAPIVEVNGAVVEKNATPGIVGRQYPMCGGSSPGEVITLGALLDGPLAFCANCHPSQSPPDLRDLDAASAMVTSTKAVCDGKPYVTRGNPDESFLYDVLAKDDPGCGVPRMPLGGELSADQIQQVYDWIAAGAPISEDDAESSDEVDSSEDE